MPPAAPDKLAKWLFERLKDSPVAEFIPQENINLICERAVSFFYAGGTLNAQGLIEWLRTEYDAPAGAVTAAFDAIKDEALSSMGVRLVMAGASDAGGPGPAPDEVKVSFARVDEPAEPPADAPAEEVVVQAAPSRPEPEPEQEPEQEPQPERKPEPAPPPRARKEPPPPSAIAPHKAWEYMKPARRDPARNLSAFLRDAAYFEWAVLVHAHDGDHKKDPLIKNCLQKSFALTPEEKIALADFSLEPGKDGATTAAWCLRMNGLALACACALELAAPERGFDDQEWVQGVRQLIAGFGDMAGGIMGKRTEARRVLEPGLEAFDAAYRRLKQIHDRLDGMAKKRARALAEAASRPSPKPAARGRAVSPSGASRARDFINDHSRAIKIAAAAVLALSVLAALYFSGVLAGSGVKQLAVDVADSGLTALSVTGQDKTMVVVIDEGQWLKLPAEEKVDALNKLYAHARAMHYSQVQVRGRDGAVLAHAWSDTDFRIFK